LSGRQGETFYTIITIYIISEEGGKMGEKQMPRKKQKPAYRVYYEEITKKLTENKPLHEIIENAEDISVLKVNRTATNGAVVYIPSRFRDKIAYRIVKGNVVIYVIEP
jgi:hypothetical protein